MCGFIGCFGSAPSPDQLQRGLHALTSRGPDDEGIYQDSVGWIGFRRLSILDLTPAGHQPMVFGDGRHVLAFNGEIYNYQALRGKFLAGVPHRSTGDSEVLGQLLERMPVEQVLPLLRGMFAFVWYDTVQETVIAARDHYGIKPLYHYAGHKQLYLSSEIRGLLELGVATDLHPRALVDFLATGSVQSPRSILSDVRSLPPGHLLRWSRESGLTTNEWYRPTWKPASGWIQGGLPAWRERVRETVFDSIRAHLESDVEVGVFLSGGLDSSLVACAMRHLGHPRLKAFSIGYEQDAGVPDESGTAERTARYLGADFECEIITSGKLLSDFSGYIRSMDQPTGDALNTYLASRLASRSVKVAMSGVGIDEWFGGYTFHRALQGARDMGLTHPAVRLVMPLLECVMVDQGWGRHHPGCQKVGQLAKMLKSGNLIDIHNTVRTFFKTTEFADSPLLAACEPWASAYLGDELETDAPDSFRNQLFALETRTFLQNTLLRDADWASMAHSLELRTPFVDREIFHLAAALPPQAKLTRAMGKYVIRECFHDILPPWILGDKKKKTFTLPKMKWMREKGWKERIHDVLLSDRFRDRGILSRRATQKALDAFYPHSFTGNSGFLPSQKIWMLFVLEEWLRAHIDRP